MKTILMMMLAACAVSIPAEAGNYRNVFVEMGYQPAEVDAKVQKVFNDVFRGPNKVYFEVGDTLGYVSDVKNHDARTGVCPTV